MFYKILLCLMIASSFMIPAAAQETPSPAENPAYLYITINPPDGVVLPFEPGESNFTPLFFETLRETLESEGYTPIFLADSTVGAYPKFFQTCEALEICDVVFAAPTPTLSIRLQSYDEDDALMISPFAAYQFEPLPVGSFGWSTIPTISAEADNLEAVVNLTAGIVLYMHRDCEAALPYLETVAGEDSFTEYGLFVYESAYFYRASCEYVLGDTQAAIDLYRSAVDMNQDDVPQGTDARIYTDYPAINLAWVYAQNGQTNEAKVLLDVYKNINLHFYSDREMERFLERSRIYLRLGEEDGAVAELTRLIEIVGNAAATPDVYVSLLPNQQAWLYTERGWLYAQIGRGDEALADYAQALILDPNYPKAYYYRGLLNLEQENPAAALVDFNRFLELAPDYYNYYDNLTPLIEDATQQIADLEG